MKRPCALSCSNGWPKTSACWYSRPVAIELRQDGTVIGGATLLPLPPDDEYEIGRQLQREAWGQGYATETGRALAGWAFEQGLEQFIAVVRPTNRPRHCDGAPDRHGVDRRDR